jgi:hypothetical protein
MRREELYLADLVDNARAVRGYLDGVTRERWDADGMLRDAVLYFGVDWAVVWKIAQEEPSVLEKQALTIISAEYPELAQRYEPGPAPESETASLAKTEKAHGPVCLAYRRPIRRGPWRDATGNRCIPG